MDKIITGNAIEVLKELPDCTADCCITSLPYLGLRDYGVNDQIGLENSAEDYINKLTDIFKEVRRVLKSDGNLWLNIGDSYATSNYEYSNCKRKDLMGYSVDTCFCT